MLIIRRRVSESILIGDEVEIQIMDLSPGRVKLGILAPKHVTILRKEVKLTAEQNQAASQVLPLDRLADWASRLRRHPTV